MDSTTIASILGILGFITSIISVIYARQQTHSAKEQVKFLREESERKKNLQRASKDLLKAIELIQKSWKVRWLESLNTVQHKILNYMHDEKQDKLTLRISPEPLTLLINPNEEVVITSKEMLVDKLKSWADEKIVIKAQFKIKISYFEPEFIDMTEILKEIQSYFLADKMLKPYQDLINTFDNAVFDDFEEYLRALAYNVYEPISKEHELAFSIDESSLQMYQKLNAELWDNALYDQVRGYLCIDDCEKLIIVQRKIFELAQ